VETAHQIEERRLAGPIRSHDAAYLARIDRGFARDDPDLLVWRASSLQMNPTLRTARLDREQRLDPARFTREYEAEFAEDLQAFLPHVWLENAVVRGRYELPPRAEIRYVAAVDPSGGGADAFTVAVVHRERDSIFRDRDKIVHDLSKGWTSSRSASTDLVSVVHEIGGILQRYGLREVTGDRYAAQWVRQAFEHIGITYRETPMDRSTAYLECEPLLAQGRLELLDHPVLRRELQTLERRSRPGRPLVDHPSGGHDDYANALCLAAAIALTTRSREQPLVW
jgi:hypothetical protein